MNLLTEFAFRILLNASNIEILGLPWTYNSEIYSMEHRSLAVSISTATNWIANLIVSSTFLTMSSPTLFNSYGSFWIYSIMSSGGVAWLYFFMPETKGLNLDQIQELFDIKREPTNKVSKICSWC